VAAAALETVHVTPSVPLLIPLMQVFNPARVLVFETGVPMAHVIAQARSLELDPKVRAEFFAQPVLSPGAGQWVADWCNRAAALVRTAVLRNPTLRHRVAHFNTSA
jgi:hypothetical protein